MTALNSSLPLLDYTFELLFNISFEKTLIIAVQHLLPTTYSLFQTLFKMGLQRENLAVLGKCYSTDPHVYNSLLKEGVLVSPLSSYFNSHLSYDLQFDLSVASFVDSIIDKWDFASFEKVIILDDGGHLLKYIGEKLHTKRANLFAVEQTSSGFNRLKHSRWSFPIVNLARAWVKTQFETPIVIASSFLNLSLYFDSYANKDISVLILGRGTLGEYIYKTLQNRFKIFCHDSDPKKCTFASEKLIDKLESSSLIIGCTGATSISQELHSYISPSTHLVSVSSTDREFDAVHLRRLIPPVASCHTDLLINGIHLLNCGFPINFNSNYSSVDSSDFQLTRSLILIALAQVQSASSISPGFVNVHLPPLSAGEK